MKNGVRQGAVLSPVLYCFYMNNLFKIMKNSKNGCFIGSYYAGMFGYADDILLICPSRTGLQEMLKLAEDYANSHNIAFSTDPNPKKSKTKGIIFKQSKKIINPERIKLCGNPLPWIEGAKYLGNYITDTLATALNNYFR